LFFLCFASEGTAMKPQVVIEKLDGANRDTVRMFQQLKLLLKQGELSTESAAVLMELNQQVAGTLAFLSAYVRMTAPAVEQDPKAKLGGDLHVMVEGIKNVLPRRMELRPLRSFLSPLRVPDGRGPIDIGWHELTVLDLDCPLEVDPEVVQGWPEGFYRRTTEDEAPTLLLLQVLLNENDRRPMVLDFCTGVQDLPEQLYVPFVKQEPGSPQAWISTALMPERAVKTWNLVVQEYLQRLVRM
jgi:hypothetical protein